MCGHLSWCAEAKSINRRKQSPGDLLDLADSSSSGPVETLVYAGLGEKDEALRSLQSAIDLHSPLVILLKVDPRLDSLRNDRRFPELLRRMNLPE